MNRWPVTYPAASAPQQIIRLADNVIPRLLVGHDPAIMTLQIQYRRSHIARAEMTGVGFFVHYDVPDDTPRTTPTHFAGGHAEIHIAGLDHPAGCILFVREGKLSLFEVYIFDDEWPEDDMVIAVEKVVPLVPPTPK